MSWAAAKTNCALQCEHDVDRAYVELATQGLPFHNDRYKNWDAAIAIHHAVKKADREARIFDAGACRDPAYPSPFLPGLQKLGFQRLYGANLDEKATEYDNGICYQHGDITKLDFPPRHFGFVACLSVIEHGVDWRLFFPEMWRIMEHGAPLFVSFDYWTDPINVGDRTMYGAPVHVFDRTEVMQMISYARDCGLSLDGTLNLDCRDRVVKWYGMEYTFCNLLFYRR